MPKTHKIQYLDSGKTEWIDLEQYQQLLMNGANIQLLDENIGGLF